MIQFKRQSLRLKTYNYAANGYYFITLCVQDRNCLLAEIDNGHIQLSPAGYMVEQSWTALSSRFPFIKVDEYVIMPDHMHGIIVINTKEVDERAIKYQAKGTSHETIGRIMQAFKSMTTNEYARHVEYDNWPTFNRRLWQRNYWERIIRTNQELEAIRIYIQKNPENWQSP